MVFGFVTIRINIHTCFVPIKNVYKTSLSIFNFTLKLITCSMLPLSTVTFWVKILFWQAIFQSAQHIYGKREGSGAGSKSIPLTSGSGSGRLKNMRIQIPNTAYQDRYATGRYLHGVGYLKKLLNILKAICTYLQSTLVQYGTIPSLFSIGTASVHESPLYQKKKGHSRTRTDYCGCCGRYDNGTEIKKKSNAKVAIADVQILRPIDFYIWVTLSLIHM